MLIIPPDHSWTGRAVRGSFISFRITTINNTRDNDDARNDRGNDPRRGPLSGSCATVDGAEEITDGLRIAGIGIRASPMVAAKNPIDVLSPVPTSHQMPITGNCR